MSAPLDLLAFSAHPDDVEMSCAGTMILHARMGKRTGIVDLTRGELGTRGTPEVRGAEAAEASKIMGLSARENLGLRDGFFENSEPALLEIIRALRKYRAPVILANAPQDRHPDHGRAAELVQRACFLSGLVRIETREAGNVQEPFRPRLLLHYLQDTLLVPTLVVDVTSVAEEKIQAVKAYRSQFFQERSAEPATYLSGENFLATLQARTREFGKIIGVTHAEGFITCRMVGVTDLTGLQ